MSAVIKALEIAAQLCKQFEGFRSAAYLCPAGVATIGYGNTFYADGTQVTLQDKSITQAEAEQLLIQSLSTQYLPAVLKASPGLIAHPEKLGALTDFAYNLGAARYRASTLRKRVDAQDWEGAANELLKWSKAGGKVLAGLTRRRSAERALFLS
jgi:GH24 family phage-related lysozyme (muramidase)